MIRTNLKFTVLALLILGLASCGTSNQQKMTTKANKTSSSITDNHWVLKTLDLKIYEDMTVGGKRVGFTLDPQTNRISGFGGCNNFMGGYTLKDGNKIEFSQMGSTKMACPHSNFPEHLFMSSFGKVKSYVIEGDELKFLDENNRNVAVFSKEIDFAHVVTEKYWKLTEMNGKTVKMSGSQEKEVYFMLKTDEERLTGFSGCNQFTGKYEFKDKNGIEFSQIAGTLRACPDVDFKEDEFLKILNDTNEYIQDGDSLILKVNGKEAAKFEAVYF